VAEALRADLPVVVAFATPGYCTSQTCAPVLGEVVKVSEHFNERATFVHVEIYSDPRELTVADVVKQWGLRTEPWIFIVDRAGVVFDRLEGLTNAAELESSLLPVL
jgi:hypothetical protein